MGAKSYGINVYNRCKMARAVTSPSQTALAETPDGVTLRVRLRPGASRNAVLGRATLADGESVVVAAVSAPPEGGKANAALIELLSKSWRLPKSRLSIVSGATARTKKLHVAGVPGELVPHLGSWLDALPEV